MACKFVDFKDFIIQMKLDKFVNKDYDVLDISSKNKKILTEFISRKQIKRTIPVYLRHLIELYTEEEST